MPPEPSPVPPESLLRHAGFLRSLAGSLALDPGVQDDAVQDTWLAAIRRPPADESRVMGWLATVLRNAVRKRQRGEKRRANREHRRARQEATASVSEQAAREEVMRGVSEALFRLTPDRRELVMLRFYEGLPPREIALRLGVPVNTVKSRLRRALRVLRNDLGGVSGPRWHATWLGFANIKNLTPATGTSPAASAGGLIAMSSKLKVAICATLLLTFSVVCWQVLELGDATTSSSPERDGPLIATDAGSMSGAHPELNALPLEARGTRDGAGVAREKSEAAGRGSLQVGTPTFPPNPTIRMAGGQGPSQATLKRLGLLEKSAPGVIEGAFFLGGTPSSDAEAYVWDATRITTAAAIPAGREPLAKVLVGSDGRFRFDHLEPGSYFVGIKTPGQAARLAYKKLNLGAQPTDKAVIVYGTATLSGSIYNEAGRPAENVTVRVSVSASGAWKTIADTRTDSRGNYEFTGLLGGMGVISIALTNDLNDGANTRYRQFLARPGARAVENFGSPNGTPTLTGTVLARCGEPVPGPGRMILSRQGSTQFLDATYDKDGRFEHRTPQGTYDVHVWLRGARGHRILKLIGALQVDDRDLRRDFEIPGARIHGAVHGADDSGNTQVTCINGKIQIWTPIAKDGTYTIDGLEPGTYELKTGSNTERVTIVEGQTVIRLDLVVASK